MSVAPMSGWRRTAPDTSAAMADESGHVAGQDGREAGQDPVQLREELRIARELEEARREDEVARLELAAEFERRTADVAEKAAQAERDRAEREASARADAELAATYRVALAEGERIRIRAAMSGSREARALRLERVRALNLRVLLPVLVGFGAWSTVVVHEGAVALLKAPTWGVMWWGLWLLEPVLLGAVAWIIWARAELASVGGRIDWQAELIGVVCLSTSLFIAVSPVWPTGEMAAIVARVAGPLGSALTAWLLQTIDTSVTATRLTGAPSLADMDLSPPRATREAAAIEPDTSAAMANESGHVAGQDGRMSAPMSAPDTRPDMSTPGSPGWPLVDPSTDPESDQESRHGGQTPRDRVAALLADDPTLTGPALAEQTGLSERHARRLRSQILNGHDGTKEGTNA